MYALQGSTAENGSNAAAVHQLGITGRGVNVGFISSRNVMAAHLAFNDSNGVHVFNSDYSGSGVNYAGSWVPGHDTWVAGITASRGWTGHLNDIGVAPGCDIYSARVIDDACTISDSDVQTALQSLINNNDCRIIMTGFQLNPNSVSGQWTLMYDYFAETYDVIFANAAGNDYSYITIFGDGYNGITTAALIDEPNNFYLRVGNSSNPGPTLDGRRKPDVAAPGSSQTTPSIWGNTSHYTTVRDGATSFSMPQTAGLAALLLEYADSTTTEPDDAHSEVIKAVIINSTFPNIKDKNGQNTDPTAWHIHKGYGRIDALRAYQTLSAGRITKSVLTSAMLGWAYDTMSAGAAHYYYIAGKKNERLILTATWNRKPTRSGPPSNYTYGDESSPKFNINLKTTPFSSPSQILFSETDPNNNLEKVDILLPADGNYTITLTNATSKSGRAYGLAFERSPAMLGDFNVDYTVDSKDLHRIISNWLDNDEDADIVPDEMVNWLDFTCFADNWLKIDTRYHIN